MTQTRILKQGKGWRLGWDPQAIPYQGLIGDDHWAMELTAAELQDFCRLLRQLAEAMTQMAEHLMEQEQITCEAESEHLWLEATGDAQTYTLRVMLHRLRRCEGYWPASVVPELQQASQNLMVY